MRVLGKLMVTISALIAAFWLAIIAAIQLLLKLDPGCQAVAKGFTNCEWAGGLIDLLYGIGFWLGFVLFAAVPCLVVGGVLWAAGVMREAHRPAGDV
jgi:hypothetical protein